MASVSPAACAGFFYLFYFLFFFFCLPVATTYIIEQGLNQVLHIQFECCNRSDMMAPGCCEAETNFLCSSVLKKKLAGVLREGGGLGGGHQRPSSR